MPASRLSSGARALTLEIAAEARAEWGFATDIIARTFRAHRELASGARHQIGRFTLTRTISRGELTLFRADVSPGG